MRVEGAWPALVSRELFDAVQEAMRDRAPKVQRPARVGSKFLLSGGPSTPALTYREGVENPGWARYVGVLCGGCARVARVRLGEMAATRRKIEAQAEVPVDWEKASARRW